MLNHSFISSSGEGGAGGGHGPAVRGAEAAVCLVFILHSIIWAVNPPAPERTAEQGEKRTWIGAHGRSGTPIPPHLKPREKFMDNYSALGEREFESSGVQDGGEEHNIEWEVVLESPV